MKVNVHPSVRRAIILKRDNNITDLLRNMVLNGYRLNKHEDLIKKLGYVHQINPKLFKKILVDTEYNKERRNYTTNPEYLHHLNNALRKC